jgi:hypothetical protein
LIAADLSQGNPQSVQVLCHCHLLVHRKTCRFKSSSRHPLRPRHLVSVLTEKQPVINSFADGLAEVAGRPEVYQQYVIPGDHPGST